MTATQVFYRFLKEELSIDGYLYFHRILKGENVGSTRKYQVYRCTNGFWSHKPVGNKTFVEDFIGNGDGRTLGGFMRNLLTYEEPALVHFMSSNKDYQKREVFKNPWYKYTRAVYIDTYCTLWRKFLKENIENYDKRIYYGRIPEFKLKKR